MLELVYLVIWVGLAFLAVFCVTILSIILEPVGATARSSRTEGGCSCPPWAQVWCSLTGYC